MYLIARIHWKCHIQLKNDFWLAVRSGRAARQSLTIKFVGFTLELA